MFPMILKLQLVEKREDFGWKLHKVRSSSAAKLLPAEKAAVHEAYFLKYLCFMPRNVQFIHFWELIKLGRELVY